MQDGSELVDTPPAGESQAGLRLDKWLAEALPHLSRSRIKALIEDGRVSSDGQTMADPSAKVKPGQCFAVAIPPPEPATPEPQDIPLDIVYEDADLVVIEKPAGLVVHPAAGNPDNTLVNALLSHCTDSLSGIGGVSRPGIVHRLDKDTSGLLVVAKNDQAHQHLAKQFEDHSIDRAYHAVVWGVPQPRSGVIEGNIGRSPNDRKKMAVVNKGGKRALTRYRVLRTFGDVASLVECRLETGRTHQIRVHMTSIGHPLVGDPVYGRPRSGRIKGVSAEAREALSEFPRQALHAVLLGFSHPRTGERLKFESDIPNDLGILLLNLEGI